MTSVFLCLWLLALLLYLLVRLPLVARHAGAALLVALGLTIFKAQIADAYQLSRQGVETSGTVTAARCGQGRLERADQAYITYRFEANKVVHTGNGVTGSGNRGCGIAPGDQVFITYLAGHPATSVAQRRPAFSVLWTVLLCIGVYTALVWVKRRRA